MQPAQNFIFKVASPIIFVLKIPYNQEGTFKPFIHNSISIFKKPKHLGTELSLFTLAIIWALNFTVVKASLRDVDPFTFNGIRFLFAAAVIWTFMLRQGGGVKIYEGDLPKLIGIGLLGNLAYQVLFIIGIDFTFSANAAVMLGTIPVWVALFSHYFSDEHLNLIKTVGVISAFAGIGGIVIGGDNALSFSSDTFTGDIIILAAAMVWGGFTMLSKSFLTRYTPLQFSTIMVTIGTVLLFSIAVPNMMALEWSSVSYGAYGGMLYSGSLSIGMAYIIWNNGIQRVGAVHTSTYQNLVPVFGAVFAFILLGESMTMLQLTGAGFVILGIVLARW